MMLYDLNTLFELIFPNINFRLLLIITFSLFFTYWFLLGLLTPLIDAVIAIVATAFVAILTVFFGYIGRLSDAIHNIIVNPVRSIIQKIPISFKIVCYLLLGLGIFAGDQRFGKQLFEFDETIQFYRLSIEGQSYWVSLYALVLSGFFIGMAALYSIGVIWKALKFILDQPIRIFIVVHK